MTILEKIEAFEAQYKQAALSHRFLQQVRPVRAAHLADATEQPLSPLALTDARTLSLSLPAQSTQTLLIAF